MIKTLIASNPTVRKDYPPRGTPFLQIAEFFYDTIQGENFVGYPSAFLRVQHCTMDCIWCDTNEVWRYGNPYSFDELFEIMDKSDIVEKFRAGQHLILTGGSPMKQQTRLGEFIVAFIDRYKFKPFIEIENECTIMPNDVTIGIVDLWNNSPKLSNSGNLDIVRYQPKIIKALSELDNAWFKFVVSTEEDWQEIQTDFLDKDLIGRDQIVLMPLGGSRKELHENRENVIKIAVRETVRYSTREHVELWDILTGV